MTVHMLDSKILLCMRWQNHRYVCPSLGERDDTSVDRDSAVERKLRLRVELFQSSARQKCRTEQDVSSCGCADYSNYSRSYLSFHCAWAHSETVLQRW